MIKLRLFNNFSLKDYDHSRNGEQVNQGYNDDELNNLMTDWNPYFLGYI